MDLVSICIPTFNGEQYIEVALKSAINQTYSKLEIIISDDYSEDKTLSLIEKLKINSSIPIKIYKHVPNGIGGNWNHCVKKATGKYIKFLFQDDILEPTCIEKMMINAISDESIGLVYCKRDIIVSDEDNFSRQWISKFNTLHKSWHNIDVVKRNPISGIELLKNLNVFSSPLNKIGEPTSVLLKKECFEKVGYFDNKLKQALDLEFWFRIMEKYKLSFVDEELIKFRLHNSQASYLNELNTVDELGLLISIVSKRSFFKLHNKIKGRLLLKYLRKLIRKIVN